MATNLLRHLSRYKRQQNLAKKLNWLDVALVLASTILYTLIGYRFNSTGQIAGIALICSLFLLFALIDLKYRLVPDIIVYPAAAATLFIHLFLPDSTLSRPLLGGAFGFFMFFIAAYLRPGELGGGDIKLAALIGLVFGFPSVLWALGLGVIFGGLVSIALLISPKWDKKSIIPYAPFLSVGAIIAIFFDPLSPLLMSMIRGG
ncbi:MAG: prepilin peptidase [Anaerolineales bacterium]|nr:prepilin peptidase [Anaerolineales bacterium]